MAERKNPTLGPKKNGVKIYSPSAVQWFQRFRTKNRIKKKQAKREIETDFCQTVQWMGEKTTANMQPCCCEGDKTGN